MATLASKLKRKMDREKTKFPEKKVCKLNEASTSELDDDTTIADNNCPKSNASKNLEEWKREKEILREKMLIENRAYIEKRMPQECKQEIKRLEEMCATSKPPTTANFKIFTNDVLLDLLRYNDRSIQNERRKPELAAAVQDSMVNGIPPRCPKCKNAMLRFSCGRKRYGKRYYWCPGFVGASKFYSCGFKASREEIKRRPWISPK